MFKVRHKDTGEIRTVYGWSGGLYFLFYSDTHGCWISDNMNYYEPVEE